MQKENESLEKQFHKQVEELKIAMIPLSDIKFKKTKEYLIRTNNYAEVFKGKYKNNPADLFFYFNADYKSLLDQIVILSQLDHENIPKFYGLVDDFTDLKFVYHHVSGKALSEIDSKTLDNKQKFKIAMDVGKALTYVHSKNFIHRDINLDNVIYDSKENKAYLIDFGISKIVQDTVSTQTRVKGKIHFTAPEVFDSDYYDDDGNFISLISDKVDVWAFGCLLSWLFSGVTPWLNKYQDNEVIIQKCLVTGKEFPIPTTINDKKVETLIYLATRPDKDERENMQEIYDRLVTYVRVLYDSN